MSCGQSNYVSHVDPANPIPAESPEGPTSVWGPALVVSNSPETVPELSNLRTVGNVQTHTLHKCSLSTFTVRNVRVFTWHLNSSGSTLYFQLALSVSTGFGTIYNQKRQLGVAAGSYVATGLCLSKAQLYGTLDPFVIGSQTLSTSENMLWNIPVQNNELIACVTEFSVVVATAANLQVRSSVSNSASLGGSWQEDPAASTDNHVRGCWQYSSASFAGGTYDVKPILHSNPRYLSVCEKTGPEHGSNAFGESSGATWVSPGGNVGCYGANLYYDFEIINSGGQSYPLDVAAIARNTGEAYFGSGRIELPNAWQPRGVPAITFNDPNDPGAEHSWIEYCSDEDGTANLLSFEPSEVPTILRVSVANAGGSATPFSIGLSGLAFEDVFNPQ